LNSFNIVIRSVKPVELEGNSGEGMVSSG